MRKNFQQNRFTVFTISRFTRAKACKNKNNNFIPIRVWKLDTKVWVLLKKSCPFVYRTLAIVSSNVVLIKSRLGLALCMNECAWFSTILSRMPVARGSHCWAFTIRIQENGTKGIWRSMQMRSATGGKWNERLNSSTNLSVTWKALLLSMYF